MDLAKIQKIKSDFDKERNWHKSRSSNVFTHLIEELGEVGRYINFEEDYKGEGNSPNLSKKELKREFAQVFSLFLQLANHYKIDLEKSLFEELKLMQERFKRTNS